MILAIDTSATVAVAVMNGDQVAAARSEDAPRGHAELLSGLVRDAMAEAGAAARDIERIVVGTGPAPFTGLRVGLVTARTLAYAWDVPVLGVCSLDALGAQHGDVTVIADARRKEIYWARYRDGVRVEGPEVGEPGALVPPGPVIGRGAVLYPDVFPDASTRDPDPAWLARVAARRIAEGETDFPVDFPTVPLYLRRPDVHGVTGT